MKKFLSEEGFQEWLLLHNFVDGSPIKGWINWSNYTNLFLEWNGLMEVIEKIEHLDEYGDYFVEVKTGGTVIKKGDLIISVFIVNEVEDNERIGKFKATYNAVVEFVQWYNEQTK